MRRNFGISATEAFTQMPEWEVDLLVDTLNEEAEEQSRQEKSSGW